MTSWQAQPRLRQKRPVDTNLSDKELFESLPLGDVWRDANLADCYRYLRLSKKTCACFMAKCHGAARLWNKQGLPFAPINFTRTMPWVLFWGTLVDFWVKLWFFNMRKRTQKPRKSTQKPAKVRKTWFLYNGIFGNYPWWYPMKGFCKLGVAKKVVLVPLIPWFAEMVW